MDKTPEYTAAATFAARLVCRERYSREDALRVIEEETGIAPSRALRALVEREIRRWLRLFDPQLTRRLTYRRRVALSVMQAVPALNLRLIGPVLSGATTEEDPVELVTQNCDVKTALLTFIDAGFAPEALAQETKFVIRWGEEPIILHALRANTPLPTFSFFGALDPDQNRLEQAKSIDLHELITLLAEESGASPTCHPSGRHGLTH